MERDRDAAGKGGARLLTRVASRHANHKRLSSPVSPAIKASFFARVQRFSCRSRSIAADRVATESNGSSLSGYLFGGGNWTPAVLDLFRPACFRPCRLRVRIRVSQPHSVTP